MLILGGIGKNKDERLSDGLLYEINSNKVHATLEGDGFWTKFHSE